MRFLVSCHSYVSKDRRGLHKWKVKFEYSKYLTSIKYLYDLLAEDVLTDVPPEGLIKNIVQKKEP